MPPKPFKEALLDFADEVFSDLVGIAGIVLVLSLIAFFWGGLIYIAMAIWEKIY